MNYVRKFNAVSRLFKPISPNQIRPYQHYDFVKLLRMKSFFFMCKYEVLINNMNNLYNSASKLLGRNFVNKFVEVMYCDLLTGGSNFKDLETCINNLEKENIISIIDYCREFLTKEEEKNAEEIVNIYLKTVDIASQRSNRNFIAVKISSLCDIDILKVYNSIQIVLNIVNRSLEENPFSPLEEINDLIKLALPRLQGMNTPIIDENDLEALKKLQQNSTGLNLVKLLSKPDLEIFRLLKKIFQIDEKLLRYGPLFHSRVDRIMKYGQSKNCSIMIDAEQSYIQTIIDESAKYFASKYNHNFCTVLQTIQCYLKDSLDRANDYIGFIDKGGLKLGIKIVRGAYMTEESRLAEKFNYENPIFPSIEDTHNAYNSLIPKLMKRASKDDKIIIASHNEDSIRRTVEFLTPDNRDSTYSAQLVGISEHIAIFSKKANLQTCKYIPFGNIDIMIPYLIRRAEESAIISKLSVQSTFLNEEIRLRLMRPILLASILLVYAVFVKNNV